MVASTSTAMAMPRPSALIWVTPAARAKDPATATTMAAAPVITRPLLSRPAATLVALSPLAR